MTTTNMISWYETVSTRALTSTWLSLYVADELDVTVSSTAPWRLYLTHNWQEERVTFSAVTSVSTWWYVITLRYRSLSSTATPTETWTWWTWKSWPAGTKVRLVLMHDQIFDKQNWWTVNWITTFEWWAHIKNLRNDWLEISSQSPQIMTANWAVSVNTTITVLDAISTWWDPDWAITLEASWANSWMRKLIIMNNASNPVVLTPSSLWWWTTITFDSSAWEDIADLIYIDYGSYGYRYMISGTAVIA